MSEENSFASAKQRLNAGDQIAAQQVFERFVGRLVALANSRLNPKLRRKLVPEDIVQSVLKHFFTRNADEPFSLVG